MPIVPSSELHELAQSIFCGAGTPEDIAGLVATSLVESNLRGHDSHGVAQIARYIARIRDGTLDSSARPRVEREFDGVSVVDCAWGFGQIGGQYGANLAIDKAKRVGTCCVALTHVHHVGRAGEYVEQIAASGQIGVLLASGAGPGGTVAAFGGQDRIFGTNPMAWSVPVDQHRAPLVSDFATAATSFGKLELAVEAGKQIEAGLLLDREGKPTTDPNGFAEGGCLLPFGEHKGYSLMLMVEILATLLCGGAPASSSEYRIGNPTLILALSIEHFTARGRFDRLVEELLETIKQSTPAPGFREVMLPGELEADALRERTAVGIPVPERIWQQLNTLSEGGAID